MPDALNLINLRTPPPAPAEAVVNNAGGDTFTVTPRMRLRRFLVLGTDGGTYYTGERALTGQNATVVLEWASGRATELVAEVVSISTAGRAPRQQPALFALAAAAALGDLDGRHAALAALPLVARTGSHLLTFAGFVEQFRGWGRGLRRAVADWYLRRPITDVAFQAVKYRQRAGWTHRDLLRLAHPATDEPERRQLFDWICGRGESGPGIVEGFRRAQAATTPSGWLAALAEYPALSWEMLPDAALGVPAVWEALLQNGLPPTALLRQLPRLTRLGLLQPQSPTLATVVTALTDADRLRRARVHPVAVLVAARTYASGRSDRGRSTWTPSAPVREALDAAFYAAFGAVQPAGRRTLLALDVSGSMTAPVSGLPISCREASAALALVTAATEPATTVVGFTAEEPAGRWWQRLRQPGGSGGISPVPISPRQRLDEAVTAVSGLPFGGTDCALPMRWALDRKIEVDTFVVYTDNETWAGPERPHRALRRYRDATGIDARLAVVGMTATGFSIADPADPGMLDVAGFDAAVPGLLSAFSAGHL